MGDKGLHCAVDATRWRELCKIAKGPLGVFAKFLLLMGFASVRRGPVFRRLDGKVLCITLRVKSQESRVRSQESRVESGELRVESQESRAVEGVWSTTCRFSNSHRRSRDSERAAGRFCQVPAAYGLRIGARGAVIRRLDGKVLCITLRVESRGSRVKSRKRRVG